MTSEKTAADQQDAEKVPQLVRLRQGDLGQLEEETVLAGDHDEVGATTLRLKPQAAALLQPDSPRATQRKTAQARRCGTLPAQQAGQVRSWDQAVAPGDIAADGRR